MALVVTARWLAEFSWIWLFSKDCFILQLPTKCSCRAVSLHRQRHRLRCANLRVDSWCQRFGQSSLRVDSWCQRFGQPSLYLHIVACCSILLFYKLCDFLLKRRNSWLLSYEYLVTLFPWTQANLRSPFCSDLWVAVQPRWWRLMCDNISWLSCRVMQKEVNKKAWGRMCMCMSQVRPCVCMLACMYICVYLCLCLSVSGVV